MEILETVAGPSAGLATHSQTPIETTSKRAKGNPTENLSNRFSALEIEEPVGLDLDTDALIPSNTSGKPKSAQGFSAIYDASESEEDELDFAVFCLFEDLRRMRTVL